LKERRERGGVGGRGLLGVGRLAFGGERGVGGNSARQCGGVGVNSAFEGQGSGVEALREDLHVSHSQCGFRGRALGAEVIRAGGVEGIADGVDVNHHLPPPAALAPVPLQAWPHVIAIKGLVRSPRVIPPPSSRPCHREDGGKPVRYVEQPLHCGPSNCFGEERGVDEAGDTYSPFVELVLLA